MQPNPIQTNTVDKHKSIQFVNVVSLPPILCIYVKAAIDFQ